jgi:hypothetical protein
MASIGAQAIWIFSTWLFWIVGAGIVNTAASSFLLQRKKCGPDGVVYCGQIRALFSASHIFQVIYYLYGIEHRSLIRRCCGGKVHTHNSCLRSD